MLDTEVNQLKAILLNYSSFIESMIELSISGIIDKNTDTLNKVIFVNEPKANDYEIQIDDKAIAIIARYAPKASALRTVQMIIKINNDLERMADHAVNISRNGIDLLQYEPYSKISQLGIISSKTISMMKDAMKSFVEKNLELATKVCERDYEIDKLKEGIISEVILEMELDSKKVKQSLLFIEIVKNIERIADLTTNISEYAIFMINGKNIRNLST